MTIRKTLLIAFLLASLLPSALLAVLAFQFASDALHAEIEQSLGVEASTVSQDLDKMLFERLQNAQTWSRLEVMQEIQVNDVDKRLAKFLSDLKLGYRDVYDELLCTDSNGRIVASSDPASVGRTIAFTDDPTGAFSDDAAIRMEALRANTTGGSPVLPIDVQLASSFKRERIGQLQLLFNWNQIHQILDQAASGKRSVMVVDRDGIIIAASSGLRQRGVLTRPLPGDWKLPGESGTAKRRGDFMHDGELTVGYDRSRGFQHFPGFGWTTLVVQPSEQAFIPVRRMALVFAALLALTSSLAVAVSTAIAGRIARPIASLSSFTRSFVRDQKLAAAPNVKGGEVGELAESFILTMQTLEKSRADLIRASKLAALGELSAMMAHEIRTPIGILRSSAQMLTRETGLSAEGRELTGFIESETERLNRLVSALLDGTRMRAPEFRANDVNDLVRQSVAMLLGPADAKGIRIIAALDDAGCITDCDAEQIIQVLLNLLHNALQILPNGGRIEIACREQDAHCVLEIADNGPGIAADELPRVFDPFFTRRNGGIGLGLSVVQHVVAAHAGSIMAGKSGLGGALFTIRIPTHRNSS